MMRSFFSLPTSTCSTAANRSFWLTNSLPSLTALMAASLIILARSEPTAPLVASAIASRSTVSSIFTSLACTFRISTRPLRSGLSTMIRRSKRPGRNRALSRISGRFVAPRIRIPLELSKPSISDSSWFRVCSRSSLPPPYLESRLRPMASISSINTIQGAFLVASLNRSRTRLAPTPTYNSIKSEPVREKNGTCASPATAFASKVLPVPGGPTNRAPLGSFAPILEYFWGLCRKSTTSTRDSFASSSPATSLKVTPVSFCTYTLALLLPTPMGPPLPPILRNRNPATTQISTTGNTTVTRISIKKLEVLLLIRVPVTPCSCNLPVKVSRSSISIV
ncbi:uncharacterized protein BN749_01389 [Firmicutes bacterium CAG:65]|nr:uncharacterized protein BN749_01389 [Firmicutes bacterium CAG:65]